MRAACAGKALFDGHYLPAYFCRSFYKHMLNKKCSTHDAESLDPSLYTNLQKILEFPLDDLGLTDLTFSVETDEFGRHKVNDLLPGGRHLAVTDANKALYVQLICQRKIAGGIQRQLEAFLSGFHELIPPTLISIFDDKVHTCSGAATASSELSFSFGVWRQRRIVRASVDLFRSWSCFSRDCRPSACKTCAKTRSTSTTVKTSSRSLGSGRSVSLTLFGSFSVSVSLALCLSGKAARLPPRR